MSLHTWWLYFTAVFLLSATPGPNMLHIMTRSLAHGTRRAVAAMAGCLAAVLLAFAASAAGLSAVLVASPALFDVLRYAGVAYLVWLGIKAWRADAPPLDVAGDVVAPSASLARLFRDGFLVAISNPKLLMFAAAFLPQFINPHAPQGPQFAILVATFAVGEGFWYAVYGLGGQSLSRHLRRPSLHRAFNRVTGGIFVLFGLALLRVRPA